MTEREPRQGTVDRLVEETAAQGRATVLTGPAGSGKSHVLRQVQAALLAIGENAPLIVGTASGSSVPLGAFASAADLPTAAQGSPAVVVDAFAHRRSGSILLVDNVDLLDSASLYAVTQLISTTRMPTILTVRDLGMAPQGIQDLYDGGYLAETVLSPLSDAEACRLMSDFVGGVLTPRARGEILAAAGPNPLHLREIIRGSVDDGRLSQTPHGWELHGVPSLTQRLGDLVAERFSRLSTTAIEAAILLALAGELPFDAISADDRKALAHADVIEATDCGWLRLSHPLDARYLLSRGSSALRHELAHRAVDVLRGLTAEARPHAQRQADTLALEYGCDFETSSMIALAEHALGSFDAPLALRAATAVLEREPDTLAAQRAAGLAASLLDQAEAADTHFGEARRLARTDAERTSVALAHAQHFGIRHSNASAALQIIQDELGKVSDTDCVTHLRGASLRWAVVAGQAHDSVTAPREAVSHEGVMSLIAAGVAGVISGPLHETEVLLPRMREVPAELLGLVPGGDSLIELTEIMALSYSGDVLATRRRLARAIAHSQENRPESLGIWEYALGFLEFLSADAERAHALAQASVSHLGWRDSAGLLPAAHALAAAAAVATGRSIAARTALDSIPESAAHDPKVAMLRTWAEAWQAGAERRTDQSAGLLLDTAEWLMTVQHTYFAGMIAHCVARMGRRSVEAAALLRSAHDLAGGGLLRLFTNHADAVAEDDLTALEQVVSDASELGLATTAADARLWMSGINDRSRMPATASRRHLLAADEMRAHMPTMALWNATADRSTLLTEREHRVVRLAADRYSAKEIAEMNGVSANTVTNQLTSAFRKLGVGSRAELRDLLGS
ncbi:AAA family ATPase [Leucobacter sp. CSA1]|uniref:AAA family ATPase n=1 Tax=Leucobacter chromiisoli TaxID=2796471 RepID=A0A934Q7U7_9MICO|nr:LuxR C-terminal-related transcriptional regulator [Leucobacter chromiisoli]MBK0419865.1 AAA family ATPase [Leucobacter chromiisoli]